MTEEIEYINRNGLNKIASETKKLVTAVDAKVNQLAETVNGFSETPDMEEITAEEVQAMFNA
jgi:hypothetical protein